MTEKISGIYKVTNTVTGKFYIGSSKNVKQRLAVHKCQSTWKKRPNNPMYIDMMKHGVDKFEFEILEVVEPDKLKEAEQQFIETLKPTYNSNNANGLNIKRRKEYLKEYQKSDKYKEYQKEYQKTDKRKEYMKEYQKSDKYKEYQKSDKYKEYQKEYQKEYHKSERYKEYQKEHYQKNREKCKECQNKYNNQLCYYNGETLTLAALSMRFSRAGIAHPTAEAKKYLVL